MGLCSLQNPLKMICFEEGRRPDVFILDKKNAGVILPIVFRNSTVKRLVVREFYCFEAYDHSSCCIFDVIGEAADTLVITGELTLRDQCFANTHELISFLQRIRSINVSFTQKCRQQSWTNLSRASCVRCNEKESLFRCCL